MEYTTLESFEGHIKEVFPDRLLPLYSVLASDRADQESLVKRLTACYRRKWPDLEVERCDLSALSLGEASELLLSQSLFTSRKLFLLSGVDKKHVPLLEKLGEGQAAIVSGFKAGAVLNLSKEKPWERKKRLAVYLQRLNSIEPNALELLMTRLNLDLSLMENAMESLACYADGAKITERHVRDLIHDQQETRTWKISESFVFGFPIQKLTIDEPFQMIGQIRYHLNTGLKICLGQETGRLKPKTVDQYKRVCDKLGPGYFQEGLSLLFDVELRAKSTGESPKALLETLYGRLSYLR